MSKPQNRQPHLHPLCSRSAVFLFITQGMRDYGLCDAVCRNEPERDQLSAAAGCNWLTALTIRREAASMPQRPVLRIR